MKNTITQLEVCELLIDYSGNIISSSELADKIGKTDNAEVANILKEFQREWDEAPCDEEGATKEQDAYIDSILENYANQLLAL